MKSLMKKTFTLIFAGVMFVTPISVEAATSGGQGTSTLTVVTKANWKKPGSESVTLSNRQVVVQGYKRTLTGKKKLQTKKYYPRYKITVKSTDGTHSFSKSMTSSSLKLNLKPDKRYKITVSYDGAYAKNFHGLSNAVMLTGPKWAVKSVYKGECY